MPVRYVIGLPDPCAVPHNGTVVKGGKPEKAKLTTSITRQSTRQNKKILSLSYDFSRVIWHHQNTIKYYQIVNQILSTLRFWWNKNNPDTWLFTKNNPAKGFFTRQALNHLKIRYRIRSVSGSGIAMMKRFRTVVASLPALTISVAVTSSFVSFTETM